MKNILKLAATAVVLVMLTSCSGDDNAPEMEIPEEIEYIIVLETECENISTQTTYCVTLEELEDTTSNLPSGPCPLVTITDIEGISHTGIYERGGEGECPIVS